MAAAPPARARLDRVAAHVGAPAAAAAAAETFADDVSSDPPAGGNNNVAPPTTPVPSEFLLSKAQVKQWVAQGYLVLELDDLPREFHDSLHRRAVAIHRAKSFGNMRQEFGAELAEDLDAILRSAKTRGALTSLLGPDFAGYSWNGGVLASDSIDQGLHKDNTSETFRDHSTRARGTSRNAFFWRRFALKIERLPRQARAARDKHTEMFFERATHFLAGM
jgi:hypothetical protein